MTVIRVINAGCDFLKEGQQHFDFGGLELAGALGVAKTWKPIAASPDLSELSNVAVVV